MALIFDRFATIEGAAAFAADVKANHDRDVIVYSNADDAAEAGFFPFALEGAAAVLVERETAKDEELVIALVSTYGGSFAGT